MPRRSAAADSTLHVLRRFDEALSSYDGALALRPDNAELHSNRSVTLFELKRFAEALASGDRAVALRPDDPEAHANRGNALSVLKRFDEAMADYDRALALRPDYAEAHTNRGVTLHVLKRFDEALQCYARALAARPDFAEAHYNEGLCRLLTGDFDRGWVEHEWWREIGQFKRAERKFAQPRWTGSQAIAGKTILLHAEQGFGDTIQFCRYAPRVAALGGRAILEVQEALRDLMLQSRRCGAGGGERRYSAAVRYALPDARACRWYSARGSRRYRARRPICAHRRKRWRTGARGCRQRRVRA